MATPKERPRQDTLRKAQPRLTSSLSHIRTWTQLLPSLRRRKKNLATRTVWVESFLIWLENSLVMTPTLKASSHIDEALERMASAEYKVPAPYSATAARLWQKFEAENWGGGEVSDAIGIDSQPEGDPPLTIPEGDATNLQTAARPSSGGPAQFLSLANATNADGSVRLPPHNHPIWGVSGIMHGLAYKETQSGAKSLVLSPQYLHAKRNAKVYGHNNIVPGTWFSCRLRALFTGCHGASQAGIVGNSRYGAYSIVISAQYDGFDQDDGETSLIHVGEGAAEQSHSAGERGEQEPLQIHLFSEACPSASQFRRPRSYPRPDIRSTL